MKDNKIFLRLTRYFKTPSWIYLLLFVVFTYLTFGSLFKTFFLQDEWQYFGSSIYALSTAHPILYTVLPFQGQLTHFFPLATLLFLGEYILFKTNFAPYALLGLLLHLANSFLLYKIVKTISKNKIIALASGWLFLINSISHQPVTWIAAGIGTLPATSLLLISILAFTYFLENSKKKYFFLSIASLIGSLLFKEISLFVLIFIPAYWMFHSLFYKHKINKKLLTGFLSVGLFYFLLRLTFIFFQIRSQQPEIGEAGTASTTASIAVYLFRIITVSFKGLSQLFFPEKFLIGLSDNLVRVAYPQYIGADGAVNPFISQSIVFDLVCFLLTIIACIVAYLLLRSFIKEKQFSLVNTAVFGFLLAATSLLPFIFIPGKVGYFSIFEPRNLYIGVMGASILVVLLIYRVVNHLSKTQKNHVYLLIIFLTPLFLFHITTTRGNLQKLEHTADIRKSLLNSIKDKYPKLPKTVIFYTESDTSYYGMPIEEKILPVQSGFGRMLMVWYQDAEYFPGCLYQEQYLHGLLDQDYKNCSERGFGYFRDYDKLVEAIKTNKVPIGNVISYSWSGKTEEFKDITFEVRDRLGKEDNVR